MASEIKSGDLVKIKSGGAVLTVELVDGIDARCIYYDVAKDEFVQITTTVYALTPKQ